jgi:hypothetical protein
MSKEIKIEGRGAFSGDLSHKQIPVGAKANNGVEVVKPQTDLNVYQEYPCTEKVCKTAGERLLQKYQEECKRDEIKHKYDDALLTPKEERKVADILSRKPEEGKTEMSPYTKERLERLQNFIGKKLNKEDIIELFEKLDEFEKEYVPKENIDKSYKANDKELIEKASKLYEALPGKKCCRSHKEEEVCDDKCNLDKAMTFDRICHEIMELHERKNKDYGNAADASFKEFGIVSYVIRLNDKLNRLKSLTKPGATMEVKDESIIDTLKDLAAYSIMAIESLMNV